MEVFLRLPSTDDFLWIKNKKEGNKLVNFTSFDEQKSLNIFAEKLKVLNKNELQNKLSNIIINTDFIEETEIPNHSQYLYKLEKAIKIIKENNLPKLVISRPILKEIPSLDLAKTYRNLCEKYPNTLCYLLINDEEIWMGATPEILGKYNKKLNTFFTMSLAGTLPLEEEWSEKEIEEQKPVTKYISDTLKNYSSEINQSETYNHISGNIKHLRTDFFAKINIDKLENLISELHPTPAVCGIPKDFCKQKIVEIENYNREFYAGYIKIETEEYIYYFVNLRCAKVYKNKVMAIAGGGITALSSPEKEWKETELKSQAILNNLAY
jgi:isochorismate synthase